MANLLNYPGFSLQTEFRYSPQRLQQQIGRLNIFFAYLKYQRDLVRETRQN